MSRSRRTSPWWKRILNCRSGLKAKTIESRRIRSDERLAVQRGDELPKVQGNATRWDPWNWD